MDSNGLAAPALPLEDAEPTEPSAPRRHLTCARSWPRCGARWAISRSGARTSFTTIPTRWPPISREPSGIGWRRLMWCWGGGI